MAGATLTRAALRWLVALLCTVVVVSSPGGWPFDDPPSAFTPSAAFAQGRAPRVWTVTPGQAAEIQPAIDAANAAGGGVVRLPAGEYLLTRTVEIRSHVAVYGDGMDRTILRWAPNAAVNHMMTNSDSDEGNASFQVWDLTLDGQGRPSGRGGCCFGLRLENVRDSAIVNVAADGHSIDGFYLGYSHVNGQVLGTNDVRLSGCRANNNSRNGIAITHGNRNIVDHCQVNNNNRGELVAGIDLEPDEGLTVSNSKIVSNQANNQNVGIQLYVPFNGYATNANNAVCFNSVSNNWSAGIYDRRGSRSIFVENQLSGNGTDFLQDEDNDALIGPQYRAYCELPALPPHPGSIAPAPTPTQPPAPTPTPPPPASCQPRPAVTVQTRTGAPGTLQVLVTATRGVGAPNNTIRQIQFGAAQNGSVEIDGQSRGPGGFSFTPSPGSQSVLFVVRRAATGQPTTVPLTVVDDCGQWPTFVGGGPSAF